MIGFVYFFDSSKVEGDGSCFVEGAGGEEFFGEGDEIVGGPAFVGSCFLFLE